MKERQKIELTEFQNLIAPLSRQAFIETIASPCLLVELPAPEDDLEDMGAMITYPDTLESAEGFRRSVPRGGERFILFFQKQDGASYKKLYSVGRAVNSDLVIPHRSVSKRHAFFQEKKNGFSLTDPSSTNGTFVDGKRLIQNEPDPIASASSIRFGEVPTYFFMPRDLFDYLGLMKRTEGKRPADENR